MPLHLAVALICAAVSLFVIAGAEDPYRFFNWNVTYGDIFPLGVRQTVSFDSIHVSFWFGYVCGSIPIYKKNDRC